jgi:DNA polymerase-3 subunit chi
VTEIRFYHLRRSTLETALPKILEKAVGQGHRAVVVAGSVERAASVDATLWTYEERSFLPHAMAPANGNDPFAADQPVWITTRIENPNGATLLVLLDGQTADDPEPWKLICEVFDGNDDAAVEAARSRWKTLKSQGHELTYWRQGDKGGWEKAG